ncbi:MAG: type I restriction endonuclease, partial [Pirellula sp.]
MTHSDFSEDTLVEQPAIALLKELGWNAIYGFAEKVGGLASTLGRETTGDVLLTERLAAALAKLNPGVSTDAIQLAIDQLAKDRSAMSLAHANREVYSLLKDGVKVSFQNDDGEEVDETLHVIDWNDPSQNDFLLVSQFWVSGSMHKRRADLVGFVNGIPLVFIELKKTHGKLEHAYKGNLKDY